jgi:1-acyl-sn-glycerol-3-phosphate acyltransferase
MLEIHLLSVIIAPDYTCFHEGQVAQQSFEGLLLDRMEIRHPTLRRTLRKLFNFLFRTLSKLEVIGVENVPPEGGYIIAVNHLSRLDPPLGYALVDRDDLTAIVTDKYKRNLLINPIVNLLNGIWIDRDIADFHAIREARKYLKAGWILGIAPEGTRSTVGALLTAKTGVAYLADKANTKIIPAAVYGTENAIRQLFRLRRPHIHMHFGEPFLLPRVERASRAEDLEQNTDEIMCQIAVMLPPSYRGAYADHPRLHELLGSQEVASPAGRG